MPENEFDLAQAGSPDEHPEQDQTTHSNETAHANPTPPVRGQGDSWMLDTLLDGILGFGISAGNAAVLFATCLLLGGASFAPSDAAVITVAIALAAFLLRMGQLCSDWFNVNSGRMALMGIYLVSMVGCIVALIVQLELLTTVLAGVAIVATMLLYGGFLCCLPRRSLMLVIDVMFVYAGCAFLIFEYLPQEGSTAAITIAVLISIVFTISYHRVFNARHVAISAADSKARIISLKGNRHTLFLVGFMAAGFLLVFSIDIDRVLALSVISGVIVAAAVFSVFMRSFDEREFKEGLKKTMGLVSVALLAPLPLVEPVVQLVLLSVYAFFVTLNLIVVLNAVVETARFDIISPFWLLGREGSIFFLGAAVGSVLFCLIPIVNAQYSWLLGVVCVAAAIICSFMQLRVNYQVYPFESILDEEDDAKDEKQPDEASQEEEVPRKGVWQRKYEKACEEYKLSPRECEVFRILIKGRDTKYIMDTFCISQSTAKTHIYNIYRKFSVHSRQDLIDSVEAIELDEDAADMVEPSDAH